MNILLALLLDSLRDSYNLRDYKGEKADANANLQTLMQFKKRLFQDQPNIYIAVFSFILML